MYHSNKYDESNQSLERFGLAFNKIAYQLGSEFYFNISKIENFRDDGSIIHTKTGKRILFDWEKRHSYYNSFGQFAFKTFGQFERKIRKPEIELSIQCSTDETGFCIAWHNDFRNEVVVNVGSKTANGGKEFDGKRFTKNYLEIPYVDMAKFYQILLNAVNNNTYDCNSFK
jgi:hypothetical protein